MSCVESTAEQHGKIDEQALNDNLILSASIAQTLAQRLANRANGLVSVTQRDRLILAMKSIKKMVTAQGHTGDTHKANMRSLIKDASPGLKLITHVHMVTYTSFVSKIG